MSNLSATTDRGCCWRTSGEAFSVTAASLMLLSESRCVVMYRRDDTSRGQQMTVKKMKFQTTSQTLTTQIHFLSFIGHHSINLRNQKKTGAVLLDYLRRDVTLMCLRLMHKAMLNVQNPFSFLCTFLHQSGVYSILQLEIKMMKMKSLSRYSYWNSEPK